MSNVSKSAAGASAYTRRLVEASMFVAISFVLKLTLELYLAESLRFNFCNVPLALAGIFLGPVWGFCVGCVSDVVNFLANNPTGNAFNPLITLATGLSGLIPGLIFMKRPSSGQKLQGAKYTLLNALMLVILLAVMIGLATFTDLVAWSGGVLTVSGKPVSWQGAAGAIACMAAYCVMLTVFALKSAGSGSPIRGDRMLFAVACSEVTVSAVVMPLILYYMFGMGFLVTLPLRFLKVLIMIPLNSAVTLTLANLIAKRRLIR